MSEIATHKLIGMLYFEVLPVCGVSGKYRHLSHSCYFLPLQRVSFLLPCWLFFAPFLMSQETGGLWGILFAKVIPIISPPLQSGRAL